MITSFFSPRIVKCFKLRTILISCILSEFILCLGIGPSKTLHFPDKLPIILISLGIHGSVAAMIFIPVLPEMIDSVKHLYPSPSEITQVNDMSSGLFQFFLAVGQIIAPIYGA